MEESFNGLEVAANETICPGCRLVHITSTGIAGLCRDCNAEQN